MKLQNMFKKNRKSYIPLKSERPEVPEGLLKKCNKCGAAILTEEVKSAGYICPKCQGYFRVHAYERIRMTVDEDSFEEWEKDMEFVNPLEFKGYEEKVKSLKEKTGLSEAVVTGKASIEGNPAVIAVCDGRFLMASMGQVVGEKITRAVERATKEQLPVIIFACSGGARMQEGIVSLMQMAKTAAALKRHSDAGLLYVSVLTDPTTGGVTASFAMLGDVILAEPKALIGFAGPRVIEQTIGEKLPKGFQRSEFLLEHGFIDRIVERKEMRTVLGNILQMHHTAQNPVIQKPVQTVEKERQSVQEKDAWERVTISRKNDRPVGQDYIRTLFSDFLEFHGDRCYGDDPAIIGGYSLAGLFALWAATKTDRFSKVAAASPSVWFPGFTEYIKENNIKAKAVYLSLGDREEKTRNPVMATVGHAIRSVHETISDSGINTILEWNQGNHFKDVDIRMAKALTWSIRATVHG